MVKQDELWDDAREVITKKAVQHQAARVKRAGVNCGDKAENGHNGKNVAARAVIPALEEFRHSENAGANVIRQKNKEQEAVDDPRIPISRGENYSVFICATDK